MVRDRAERIANTIRIVDEVGTPFEQQLADPDFTLTANGFVDLVELEQLLERKPTERPQPAGLDGLLGRLRLDVHGGELERASEAGDVVAAQPALKAIRARLVRRAADDQRPLRH